MELAHKIKQYIYSHYGPIILIIFGLLLHYALVIYGREICEMFGCTSDLRRFYLEPLREGGLIITAVAVPFLLLPKHYFYSWFIWMFVPLLILDVYNHSQKDIYINMGITNPSLNPIGLYLILTLAFILSRHILVSNTKLKYLYIVLTILLSLSMLAFTNSFLRNGFVSNYL